VRVDEVQRRVVLSKLFEWYRVDFGRTGEEVLRRVVQYMGDSSAGTALERMLRGSESGAGKAIEIEYSDYDWGTNAA
jgi:hypothetical protein